MKILSALVILGLALWVTLPLLSVDTSETRGNRVAEIERIVGAD